MVIQSVQKSIRTSKVSLLHYNLATYQLRVSSVCRNFDVRTPDDAHFVHIS